MQIIRPLAVTDGVLASTNVAETTPLYNAGATYGEGDLVRDDATHQAFESLQAGNTGHALGEVDWWLPVGATNPWRMFDQGVGSQTTNPDSIAVEFTTVGIVDSVALLNINAAEAQITVTDGVEGVVYDETFSLVDNSNVVDWYTYFFEPIVRRTDLQVTGISLYANATLDVELRETGGEVACGECVIGQARRLGRTQWGAQVGVQDFSTKEQDGFGGWSIVERAFSKRGVFPLLLETASVDYTMRLLSDLRATPLVFIGDPAFGSMLIYGFYRELNIEVAFPNLSYCTLETEGLT